MQNMVKVLKQSSISLHFEKHKGVNGWTTKAQRTRTVNDIQTKISSLTERTMLSETKDDRRTYGERVDDRLEAGYEE